MKNLRVVSKLILSTFVVGMVFISCSDSDNPIDTIDQSQDTAEVALSAEIDQVDGVLADLVIDAYELEENETVDRSQGTYTNIPECVTLTVVAQQNYRQITLDFGDEGCLIQGHLLRGQIVFDYSRNPGLNILCFCCIKSALMF